MSTLISRRLLARSLSVLGLSVLALALSAPAAVIPIPVANAAFEDGLSSVFSTAPNAISGWVLTPGQFGAAGVQAGEFLGQISAPNDAGYLYQGSVGIPDVLEQTLTGYPLVASGVYTLTIDVSTRDISFDPLTVNLFAGATLLSWTATGANTAPVPSGGNNVQPWSFIYVAPAVPALGDLKLQFVAGGGDLASFDNIALTQEVPEPAALSVLGLTVSIILARRRRN